jgi:hypothetical protein
MATNGSWRDRLGPDGPALIACALLIAWSLAMVAVHDDVIASRWIFWLMVGVVFVGVSAVWSVRIRRAEEADRRRRKRPFQLDETSGPP